MFLYNCSWKIGALNLFLRQFFRQQFIFFVRKNRLRVLNLSLHKVIFRKVGQVGKMWKEITIAAYVYVFIVKKLKDHIKNSKYYETANLKTGETCLNYIAHLSARAHNYTPLRHESKENMTAVFGRILWSFCLIILRNMSMLNQLPSSRNIL